MIADINYSNISLDSFDFLEDLEFEEELDNDRRRSNVKIEFEK